MLQESKKSKSDKNVGGKAKNSTTKKESKPKTAKPKEKKQSDSKTNVKRKTRGKDTPANFLRRIYKDIAKSKKGGRYKNFKPKSAQHKRKPQFRSQKQIKFFQFKLYDTYKKCNKAKLGKFNKEEFSNKKQAVKDTCKEYKKWKSYYKDFHGNTIKKNLYDKLPYGIPFVKQANGKPRYPRYDRIDTIYKNQDSVPPLLLANMEALLKELDKIGFSVLSNTKRTTEKNRNYYLKQFYDAKKPLSKKQEKEELDNLYKQAAKDILSDKSKKGKEMRDALRNAVKKMSKEDKKKFREEMKQREKSYIEKSIGYSYLSKEKREKKKAKEAAKAAAKEKRKKAKLEEWILSENKENIKDYAIYISDDTRELLKKEFFDTIPDKDKWNFVCDYIIFEDTTLYDKLEFVKDKNINFIINGIIQDDNAILLQVQNKSTKSYIVLAVKDMDMENMIYDKDSLTEKNFTTIKEIKGCGEVHEVDINTIEESLYKENAISELVEYIIQEISQPFNNKEIVQEISDEEKLKASDYIHAKTSNESDILVFKPKDKLNPTFFENEKLKPNIRKHLLKLVNYFLISNKLKDKIKIKDILLTGSLANYNYNEFSDIDTHIVADYADIFKDKEIAIDFFLSKKGILPGEWRITVHGYPVEIFVTDIEQKDTYNAGVYSIAHDKWIQIPSKENIIIKKEDVKKEVKHFLSLISDALSTMDSKIIKGVTEKIYDTRKKEVKENGEFSPKNIAFKILRNNDVFEYLKDKIAAIQSNEMSI